MAPYMQTVYEKVSAIATPSGKDLFQLNEAIFNVERDDDPSPQLAGKLFAWMQKMHRDFLGGKIGGADENFFYDYLGLLGTMQNQHFFSAKQVQRIQGFMLEGLNAELGKGSKDAAPKAATGDVAKLQKENDELKKLLAAVQTIQAFKLGAAPAAEGEGKKKKGKKGEAAPAPEAPAEEPKKAKKPRNRKKKGEGEGEEAPKEAPKEAAPEGEAKEKKPRQRNRKGKKEGEAKEGGDA